MATRSGTRAHHDRVATPGRLLRAKNFSVMQMIFNKCVIRQFPRAISLSFLCGKLTQVKATCAKKEPSCDRVRELPRDAIGA
jgi:hypothetical protein